MTSPQLGALPRLGSSLDFAKSTTPDPVHCRLSIPLPEEGVDLSRGGATLAHDLTPDVDGTGSAFVATQRAKIGHNTPLPEEGV